MHVLGLEAENFKRLRAIRLRLDEHGNLVVIGGENGAGKSSALDAIEAALGGKDHAPAEPVRRGAEEARVVVDLGDILVSRRYGKDGTSRLEVHERGKGKASSPQALLDSLVGRLTFDPLAFLRMPAREQAETLRRLVGLDTAEIEARRKAAFDERTLVNRAERELAGAHARMPEPAPGTPETEVALKDRLDALQAARAARERKRAALEDVVALGRLREAKREAVDEARTRLDEAERAHESAIQRMEQAWAKAAELPDADEAPALRAVEEVEAVNAAVRQGRARTQAAEELRKVRERTARLGSEIEALDAQKAKALAAAAFPVDGLGIDTERGLVTFDGLPLEQASQAEALRVSVAMGIALHPRLRTLLIRDGSLLDGKSLALLARLAEETGTQLLVERVGAGPEVSVVIEDGMVAQAKEVAP